MNKRSILVVITMLSIAMPAQAQEFVASYGNWWVFNMIQNNAKTCYIASAPIHKTGNYSKRGEPHLMITSRGPNADEVSAYVGYPLKLNVEAKIEIDDKPFKLFTEDERIWAYSEQQDRNLVNLLKKGDRALVRGISQRNSFSIDTYSLKGFSMAYNKMKAVCR